jgi:hypothetical protein
MVGYWCFFKPLAYLLKNLTLLKTVPGHFFVGKLGWQN